LGFVAGVVLDVLVGFLIGTVFCRGAIHRAQSWRIENDTTQSTVIPAQRVANCCITTGCANAVRLVWIPAYGNDAAVGLFVLIGTVFCRGAIHRAQFKTALKPRIHKHWRA
jgi:hypothetical protein